MKPIVHHTTDIMPNGMSACISKEDLSYRSRRVMRLMRICLALQPQIALYFDSFVRESEIFCRCQEIERIRKLMRSIERDIDEAVSLAKKVADIGETDFVRGYNSDSVGVSEFFDDFTGFDENGEVLPDEKRKRIMALDSRDYEWFMQFLDRYSKKVKYVRQHGLEWGEPDVRQLNWAGWNSEPVVWVNPTTGEWRQFSSKKQASRAMGLSYKKITSAITSNELYDGKLWMTADTFENCKDKLLGTINEYVKNGGKVAVDDEGNIIPLEKAQELIKEQV